ncbi:hypothetical protein [Thermococcus sp.]|uniref:hypothetical protein n=1 Tax=Thermococcus sp. TaxID=35749 RepID=UPI00260AC899|nr:hypothetical protein [Thermococcus sp.]
MRLVVLSERGSALALAFMVVFMAVFLAMFGFMLLNVPGGSVFILGFSAFFMATMLFGVYALLRKRREYRRAQNFAEMVSFSDSGVSFQEGREFEIGRLEMRGYWVGSGRNRSYHVERKFIPGEKGVGSSIPFPSEGFRVTVAGDGTGEVSVPAVRIRDEPYKGILLLFFTDEGAVRGSGTITLAVDEDSAQVSFRGDGKFITGSVYSELRKARGVKVTIGAEGFSHERVIGRGRSFEFRKRMLPKEKVVMVGTYGTVTPKMVLSSLGDGTVVMGHGEFIIRGILDVPLRPDVRAGETFTVELEGGKEEKEFEEEWSVF